MATEPILRLVKGAALTAADHDGNVLLSAHGFEPVKLHGATGNGTTNDRAAFLAADAAGAAMVATPGVYRFASDTVLTKPLYLGGATLKPDNGVTVHLGGGYSAGDWDHVFDISAGGRVTGVAALNGAVTPQHYGATAYNFSLTDTPAIQAAVRHGTLTSDDDPHFAASPDVKFPMPRGTGSLAHYHINDEIIVHRTVEIYGEVPNGSSGVRIFVSKPAKAGFVILHPADDDGDYADGIVSRFGAEPFYGGTGTKIRDLRIWAKGFQTGTALEAKDWSQSPDFGILHNTRVRLESVHCQGFYLAGMFAHAQSVGDAEYGSPIDVSLAPGVGTMYGNTHRSLYIDCEGKHSRGPGFAAQGDRAGGMLNINGDAILCWSSGYYDNSGDGNGYINCHSAQNSYRVGKNGHGYMCIKTHTSSAATEPEVGEDWERHWKYVNDSFNSAWASGQLYTMASGIGNTKTEGQFTWIEAQYSEGGIELGCTLRGDASLFGGLAAGAGRVIRHPEFLRSQVYGSVAVTNPQGWRATVGGFTLGASLGKEGSLPEPFWLMFGTTQDNALGPQTVSVGWDDTDKIHAWKYAEDFTFMAFTGTGWTGGNHAGAGRLLFPEGIVIGSGSTSSAGAAVDLGVHEDRSALLAALAGQQVKKGKIWLYADAVPGGKVGGICTTGGTVGSTAVITDFGTLDA